MHKIFIRRRQAYLVSRFLHLGQDLRTEAIEENLCIVQKETNDLELEVRTVIQPKENEVLIRIASVCICNDLANNFQLYTKQQNEKVRGRTSIVLGNLASGVIAKTGTETSGALEVGDRVVMEPGVCCQSCQSCNSGQSHLCQAISYIGTSARDGALCKYMVHPANFCHKLNKNVSLDFATLTTKVACSVHCYEKAKITSESKVLIIGSGLLGLVTLMVLKHLGVGSIFVAEMSNYRLEVAKKLGADFVLKIAPQYSPEYPEYLKEIITAIYSEPPDITIDTIGSPYSVETSFHMTKSGGKVVLMAAQPTTQAPFLQATLRELNIIGCYSYTRSSFQKALKIIQDEDLALTSLTTLKVPINRAIDAYSYHRATDRENIFTIIRNYDHEKVKETKESGGEETKTAAIPKEMNKSLDKNTVRVAQKKIKKSIDQNVSDLSDVKQVPKDEKKREESKSSKEHERDKSRVENNLNDEIKEKETIKMNEGTSKKWETSGSEEILKYSKGLKETKINSEDIPTDDTEVNKTKMQITAKQETEQGQKIDSSSSVNKSTSNENPEPKNRVEPVKDKINKTTGPDNEPNKDPTKNS